MKSLENLCAELITYAGMAKSAYIEAMNLFKDKRINDSKKELELASTYTLKAHEVHFELIKSKHNPTDGLEKMLLIHAEDQLANNEVIGILSKEVIEMYSKFDKTSG